ncbi:MAG: 4Fe-4S ferredoxin [Candidatus Cloacimonas sp. 4484_275]|nr:MAG: 4Fe-4S ferredoxin [Candidatus Cloacimonas sp. 4484_275]RLC51905.1 MAG: 4Fe-4S ferredoxin [Candidatus Cloacimonadota bacterium]
MSFIITSECIKCGMCVDVCPVSAIVEAEEQYIITDACIDCGDCVTACPIDAIKGKKD